MAVNTPNKTLSTAHRENNMQVQLTVDLPEQYVIQLKKVSNTVISDAVREALEKESKNTQGKEDAFQAILNFKPIKGKNPKTTTEIIREGRENPDT